jgi:hypothetical protein
MHDNLPNFGEIFMKLSGSMETWTGRETKRKEEKKTRSEIDRERDRQT